MSEVLFLLRSEVKLKNRRENERTWHVAAHSGAEYKVSSIG